MILRVVYVVVILGKVAGTCECGNEHSGSIERGECLDYLRIG